MIRAFERNQEVYLSVPSRDEHGERTIVNQQVGLADAHRLLRELEDAIDCAEGSLQISD